ncbi:D-lactate ferricytochrome c oxidoreductase [Dispira simplex]|nr:D-lactate ferricytochrome c oxidoreductase [Dispira simplex]
MPGRAADGQHVVGLRLPLKDRTTEHGLWGPVDGFYIGPMCSPWEWLVGRRWHTSVNRSPEFKKLDADDIHHFRSILSPANVLTDLVDPINQTVATTTRDKLAQYNTDWLKLFQGASHTVLFPETTDQVASVLRYCAKYTIAVVPQGGNTCVTGASVPVFDELILNLSKMNQIRQFCPSSGVLVCDAGCILQTVDHYLEPYGYTVPLDLAAKGSCQVGGNVATNAGGVHFIRYGSLRGTVLGLEVVLPTGDIMDNLFTLRKDNAGYDLKQLFIGSEGTLGVITGVALQTFPTPTSKNVALLGVNTFTDVLSIYTLARTMLCDTLSAFEFWDHDSMELLFQGDSDAFQRPFAQAHFPFYLLIETSSNSDEHNQHLLARYLERLLEDGLVSDGTMATNQTKFKALWGYRERIPLVALRGHSLTYDLTLPVEHFYSVVTAIKQRLLDHGLYRGFGDQDAPVRVVCGLGHLGDGNIHLLISLNDPSEIVQPCVEPFIYRWVSERRGSISAEHGLGITKAPYLCYSKSPVIIDHMQRIKQVFDPQGIMNPYKMLV